MEDCANNQSEIPNALAEAFDKAHNKVCECIDAVKSGTTVVLNLIVHKQVITFSPHV